jgi:hypothetical protein
LGSIRRHLVGHGRHGGWSLGRSALALVAAALLGACDRGPIGYDQSTPDNVVKSAVQMVKDNQARSLSTLIYAESPDMRATLTRLGKLFENMQKLSKAAQERFPDEFAKLREDAQKAAADGKPNALLSAIMNQQGGRRSRGGGTGGGAPDPDTARDLVNQLFADPYGWIERNASRLSTIKPADDSAFVLLDGQPAIPIIGLAMRKEGEKWYVSLPSNVPPISSVWPRNRTQWSILASLVKILDNAVLEMTGDVQAGRVSDLKGLVDKASDKLLFPAGIAFVAYGKELDVRSRVDRRLGQFNRRQSAWVKERQTDGGKGVSDKLLAVLSNLAPGEVEAGVRKQRPPSFEDMSHPDFEKTIKEWLTTAGLAIDFSGDLASPSVDDAVVIWEKNKPAPTKK